MPPSVALCPPPLLVWSAVLLCALYFLLVKDPLWVSVQLWWLLHISCFILNFTALSYMDEGPERSAGLRINLQWYSLRDDCSHIFDLTSPYPTFTLIFIFHVTAELVIVDTTIQRVSLFDCVCAAARMYTDLQSIYRWLSLVVTISGEVNKNLLGRPGCE